jgi:hypothetical protein
MSEEYFDLDKMIEEYEQHEENMQDLDDDNF